MASQKWTNPVCLTSFRGLIKYTLMFGYKVYFNYFLWRLGIRDVLPGQIVDRKNVRECNDQFVKIDGRCLRKGVAELLKVAESKLPKGVKIKILSAHRPIAEQQKLWNNEIKNLRRSHPDATDMELHKMARWRVADPKVGGGHQTGGAVDVTLVDSRGRELDMGGKYLAFDATVKTKAVKNKNREILYRAMIDSGFVNYAYEWWHYSYGDKMWAAYKRKKYAIYGIK